MKEQEPSYFDEIIGEFCESCKRQGYFDESDIAKYFWNGNKEIFEKNNISYDDVLKKIYDYMNYDELDDIFG